MKVGFITIGQSPRLDVMKDLNPILEAKGISYVECGALDGLTREQIDSLAPESDQDYILVTRLKDGTEVKLSRSKILSLMQGCIQKLEGSVNLIGILCTGDFPELKSEKLLLEPSLLLKKVVEAISQGKDLTVLIPSADQENEVREKWGQDNNISVVPISPYTSRIEDFRRKLNETEAGSLVIMDCIGYSAEMKEVTQSILNRPVVLPRTLLANLIGELNYQ